MAAFTNTTLLADTSDVDGFMGLSVPAGFTETMQDLVGVYTEAFLCNVVKYDVVTNFGTLNAVFKLMLSEYVARAIAVEAIKFDMNSYTDRIEAEDMIEVHVWNMKRIIGVLESDGIQDFLGVNS